ncbi:MAG TPA: [cytidine(C)-cytidine(C)-adenosine (A)]-adding enzyme [Myxococcaceae bacterium]|nr:[cytidine(C)-cytidine(C)-adenosine (A)]-adding enzyme [Myxococcaceae bacterium]
MQPLPHALAQATIPAGVRSLLERLQSAGHEAWLVGGGVRDLLRGLPPKDWDIATQALPQEVMKLFRRVVPTGIAHGTVTVLVPEGPVEVTTFRVESAYVDGRRPGAVEFRRDLVEDLARRDFTINALAFDPVGGRFRDPFGGQVDLARKRVRCVGVAAERFGEDGLRPLRAVRFATVLDFELEPETEAAIPGALGVFDKVALERRRDEFLKLLLAPGAVRGLELLRRTGLMGRLLPELAEADDPERHARVGRSTPVLEVRLAALLAGAPQAEGALDRLRLPARTVETVRALLAHPLPRQASGWTDGDLRRWLVRLGPERWELARALARATGVDPEGALGERLARVVEARPPLSPKDLALDGAAIMKALGVGPSPAVGEAARFLLDAVLERPELNTEAELERLLRQRHSSAT